MEVGYEKTAVAAKAVEDDGAAKQLKKVEGQRIEMVHGGETRASVGVSTETTAMGVTDAVVVEESARESIVAEQVIGAVFEQSNCFTDTRPGYVFTSGQNGVGYYRDHRKAKPGGKINVSGGKKSVAMAAAEDRYRGMDRGRDQ